MRHALCEIWLGAVMVKIKCTIDAHQVKAGLEALGKDAPKASARAINRTLATVNTQAVRGIAEDLGVAQKHVRPSLRIYRANTNSLRGSLQGTGRRIPLYDFAARQTKKGVSYRMQGQRKTIASAFIATMRSGHTGVFARKGGAKRLPIAELKGPSVPHVFRKHITSALRAFTESEFGKNLRHEIGYLLTFGKRG